LTKSARLKSERLQRMKIEDFLWEKKKNLLTKMLYNKKVVLAWEFFEISRIKHEVASLAEIRIISYKAWQSSEFQILKILIDVMTDMIKKRVQNEILESCHESYRNLWFLMKKKKKEKYRLVNVVLKMNKVIIRDVNLSFSMNEFFENFAECVMIFLMNFFSEYDQMTLNKKSRDMTTFMTSIELYRMTTLS
jgi:hypothetical protein